MKHAPVPAWHALVTGWLSVSIIIGGGPAAYAGDILRGGARVGQRGAGVSHEGALSAAQAAAAARLRANSADALSRTTQAVQSVRAMQASARAIAASRTNLGFNPRVPGIQLPDVPEGLRAGGLVPDSGLASPGVANAVSTWKNALTPVETVSGDKTTVTIKQTDQQALLYWSSFNIGRKTKLSFDQSAGGADRSKWVAFNKVTDPSGVPSQILGTIEAPGQVYVVNRNGVIFGGASQVNTHALTVSSLPINTNLVAQGLLNNPDAQFLFTALPIPGGADGTPAFDPGPLDEMPGDIIVQAGAQLNSPLDGEGKGGRIMLVGPNIINEGTISTPSGQTVLAAGLQVGIGAHAAAEPSLRGLDVWVGQAPDGTGKITHLGEVDAGTGAITFVGREILQHGNLLATTSVDLNGRIDLLASYGAVSNPNYDNTGTIGYGAPIFFNQFTGVVDLGVGSTIRILPSLENTATPGTTLANASQVNLEGKAIHVGERATVYAPSGNVTLRAGSWPYKDTDGNGTVFGSDGLVDPTLRSHYSAGKQKFLLSEGQVYIEPSALLSVAGLPDVFIPLAHHILTVELRGSELADSPLQRLSALAAVPLTIDLRKSGDYYGRYWMGTPLGDATGFAALVERTAAQKAVQGGNLTVEAGESIVIREGATLDVSGGYYRNEGGIINTTRLVQGSNIIDIANADPGQIYDGIYNAEFVVNSAKWGITKRYVAPLAVAARYEPEYLAGGAGGTLKLTSPAMALDGALRGTTLQGERQRNLGADLSTVSIAFRGEKAFSIAGGAPSFLPYSPTPPKVTFLSASKLAAADSFLLTDGSPEPLRADRVADVTLTPALLDEDGFGFLNVENADGDILVPAGVKLATAPRGGITLQGANVRIDGKLSSPGGSLRFATYNISPTEVLEFALLNPAGGIYPSPNADRGFFELGAGAVLSTAGLVLDERTNAAWGQQRVLAGGSIAVESFHAVLERGSVLDVSGGLAVTPFARVDYGAGGAISLLAGRDAALPSAYDKGVFQLVGGSLQLGAELLGYSGAKGGSLTLQAHRVEIAHTASDAGVFLINPSFFREGGFASYGITGIGAPSTEAPVPGQPDPYLPGLLVAPGTVIEPRAERLLAIPNAIGGLKVVRYLPEQVLRQPSSLSLSAIGFDNPFTIDTLEIRGDLVMGAGSVVRVDPGASVALKGQTVTALGSIIARGGGITLSGASSFPLASAVAAAATQALATVYIGPEARLDARGIAMQTPDAYGRRTGVVLGGGKIAVSGNIVASEGAVLDVSGAQGTFDTPNWMLGLSMVPDARSGINQPLASLGTQRVKVASSGGQIALDGSQMLFSDATLLGNRGGAGAAGGVLSIFSGRFYQNAEARTGADINLVVRQSGNVLSAIGNPAPGVGIAVLDDALNPVAGMGYFAADRFLSGGFDSLDLGGKYLESASPIPFGGNIRFEGEVSIAARGFLRVAGGGVVEADAAVNLSAPYLGIGQPFRAPQNPGDTPVYFEQTLAASTEYAFAPTNGSGSLVLAGRMIDAGTLVMRNIGSSTWTAQGDIRGNGVVNIAGALDLQAAQIYPTTLSTFDLFAYDHAGGAGSITIRPGQPGAVPPLAAGGKLGLYASTITHAGHLRSTLGTIQLGWDGSDLNPATSAVDAPYNPVVGTLLGAPVTDTLTLAAGSLTSVAAIHPDGTPMLIPFGISPDGTSWIAPDGTNITLSGVSSKEVVLMGGNVIAEEGSLIDLRGGGDLAAYRWISGVGGSADLLGSPGSVWSAGSSYKVGDLVSFNGARWSARAASTGVAPSVSLYWTRLPESYAILPGLGSELAPYAAYNTGENASLLQGNPGWVSNLAAGDSIYLAGGAGLKAGNYTLLPSQYALLPGAYLVSPAQSGGTAIGYTTPEGAAVVSGYRYNTFGGSSGGQLQSRYEVASRPVVMGRVAYEGFSANGFLTWAAVENKSEYLQRLPVDAGHLVYQGNLSMQLDNQLLAGAGTGGRGALVDISSTADLWITDGTAGPSGITLDAGRLSSWEVGSLLVGGVRTLGAEGIQVNATTGSLTLANGATLSSQDVVLVSRGGLNVESGASIVAREGDGALADLLNLSGNGVLLRVSADKDAAFLRTGVGGPGSALLTVAAGATLTGRSVTLDSSHGSQLDAGMILNTETLALGSGQVSLIFDDTITSLSGSLGDPHLVLSGALLDAVQQVDTLRIVSYSSIDFYGSGVFGNEALGLDFVSSGIRGFGQGAGSLTLQAKDVRFSNPGQVVAPAVPADSTGLQAINAQTIRAGKGSFRISGYATQDWAASGAYIGEEEGSLTVGGDLTLRTPLITGANGAVQALSASGALRLEGLVASGESPSIAPGLGVILSLTGASVDAGTTIALPSGRIHLRATAGDILVTGELSTAGTARAFDDLLRTTDGGEIILEADLGNVVAQDGSLLDVSAHEKGGNAGTLRVLVPGGQFTSAGELRASAAKGESGHFVLDTHTLPEISPLNLVLDAGGFHGARKVRVRTGDVLLDGVTQAREILVAADTGSLLVTGELDASGPTGGTIDLIAHGSVSLADTARLSVRGEKFSSAGKGGAITLEAGATADGVANTAGWLDLSAPGAVIDLGVDAYLAGGYQTPGSSAFLGQYTGKLHLRAPRSVANSDLNLSAIGATITGASGILAEGYEVVDLTSTGGLITGWRTAFNVLPAAGTVQRQVYDRANAFLSTSNHDAMVGRILGADTQDLASLFVLAPGVELVNRNGDLILGSDTSTATAIGTSTQRSGDWNLADFRFGPKKAPGVLTMRASGNLAFYNALSDGFAGTLPSGTVAGNSLWLSPLMTAVDTLPMPLQSWSYRLAAGADLGAADFRQVLPESELAVGKGSLLLGKFYAANLVSGANASTATATLNRYQVIRTGAGDIDIATARDVRLRNVFASIYTAGVAVANPTSIYSTGDFVIPIVSVASAQHPGQGSFLGGVQQNFVPQWSMAGGDLTIEAKRDIGRYTMHNGVEITDTSRQVPTNWLYRRGYVDPETGLFAVGGVNDGVLRTVTDPSASTTWWIDFSNFFQGLGALGGGDVAVRAGRDIINTDAVVPTNARMPGRVDDGAGGYTNIAPDASALLELGGGNLLVQAGRNIDGGIYYVERGTGRLIAGGEITTNERRSPSLGIHGATTFPEGVVQSRNPAIFDSLTWLPTTLFVGKSSFDVSALGDVLIGPAVNAFLTPQGLNNKYWYKTYFNTYAPDAAVSVASYGGGVTHRNSVTLPGELTPRSVLDAWLSTQNLYSNSAQRTSNFQPWLRLAEADLVYFQTVFTLNAPTLQSTAFSGDINLVGRMTLFPSPTGTLELAAAGSIQGLNPSGRTTSGSQQVTVWTAANLNVSDANPASVPHVATPLAYQVSSGRSAAISRDSRIDMFRNIDPLFEETGSYSGRAGTPAFQQMLHMPGLLHAGDTEPLRLYAMGGELGGFTLFAPKATRILAGGDIADIAFYLQNTSADDISLISAGGDLTAYHENSPRRALASNLTLGNLVGDLERTTVSGGKTRVLSGDIQIGGPGTLEVLAGGNLDLGTGSNLSDGTGVGLTSIGNFRNPYLPFGGADLVVGAGLGSVGDLSSGKIDFTAFQERFILNRQPGEPDYLAGLGLTEDEFFALGAQERALVSTKIFYQILRDSGRAAAQAATGVSAAAAPYVTGQEAIALLFPESEAWSGDIFTRARDVRTTTGGAISMLVPGGGIAMASDIFGNPLTPPGIVTEYGGGISLFTDGNVDIGRARIFTLRGGDVIIWSSRGDIAAGTSPKTVVTAPPTRVVIDITSADVATDLGGLATGGGIGVLASVPNVQPGDVDLIAPTGVVDAGDAGIRSTGNLSIAATTVLNAGNIQAAGASTGVPSTPTVAPPNIAGMTAASSVASGASSSAQSFAQQQLPTNPTEEEEDETPSLFNVEVIGYGG